VVLPKYNFSLRPFPFLIVAHQSHTLCVMLCIPLYVLYAGYNVSNDLQYLLFGQVKASKYNRYDINGYHFRTVKLEMSHPPATTINSEVVDLPKLLLGHIIIWIYNIV
jgi:hypothetical protein